jgi:hypothetical protein
MYEEFDDTGILEEIDDVDEDTDAEQENNIADNFDVELDATEMADSSQEKKEDTSEEFIDIPAVDEIDDNSAEPLEEVRIVIFVIFIYF